MCSAWVFSSVFNHCETVTWSILILSAFYLFFLPFFTTIEVQQGLNPRISQSLTEVGYTMIDFCPKNTHCIPPNGWMSLGAAPGVCCASSAIKIPTVYALQVLCLSLSFFLWSIKTGLLARKWGVNMNVTVINAVKKWITVYKNAALRVFSLLPHRNTCGNNILYTCVRYNIAGKDSSTLLVICNIAWKPLFAHREATQRLSLVT